MAWGKHLTLAHFIGMGFQFPFEGSLGFSACMPCELLRITPAPPLTDLLQLDVLPVFAITLTILVGENVLEFKTSPSGSL